MSARIAPVPDISVIVVSFNTAHLLHEMFASLDAARGDLLVEVVVVDNASSDDSVAVIRRDFPSAKLIVNDKNVGFGRANNQALPHVRGRLVLLLNTDAFILPDTLQSTAVFIDAQLDVGIVGVKLIGRDGELQPSCRYFPTPLNGFVRRTGLDWLIRGVHMVDDKDWDPAAVRECDWVPGCYYLMRREVIDQIGLFDPRFFLYCEEVDHCRRAKAAGWKVVYFPDTSVIHIGGESAKSVGNITSAGRQISALQIESEFIYFRKHYGITGVVASAALAILGDFILAMKAIFRQRCASALSTQWTHCKTTCLLLVRTSLGARPTR